MDLQEMNLTELKQLRRDLDRAIASYAQRQMAEARVELEARARELGFTLAEVAAASTSSAKRMRPAAAPKYRNPQNPEETWSGRGRKPRWVTEALTRAGAKMEDFLI
jgi:DNA-binding protein H-NS